MSASTGAAPVTGSEKAAAAGAGDGKGGQAVGPTAPRSRGQAALHEIFTVVLAGAILILTLWMIVQTFASGEQVFTGDDKQVALKKDAYERQKDLMLYGLSLLGTVTGYYLGRVPAERRADGAERSADKAQKAATAARNEATRARRGARKANQDKAAAKAVGNELVRQAKTTLQNMKGAVLRARATQGDAGASHEVLEGVVATTAPDLTSIEAEIGRMEATLNKIA